MLKNGQFRSSQVTGNVGLYFICYQLSKRGWNVMPTSRNARGIDIVIYSQDGNRKYTIQSKSLTRRSAVPLGNNLDNIMGDYIIICRNVLEQPDVFIAPIDEIRNKINTENKSGKISHWLEPKDYEQFKDRWSVIGDGF